MDQQQQHHRNIVSYYNHTWLEYRVLWINKKNRALHFGYYEDHTRDHSEALTNLNRVMAQKVGISSSDHVLDAGCGQGGSALWLSENLKARVTGITLVPHQVVKAQKETAKRNLGDKLLFEVKDYCNTGYADGSFDVIWACESVCHTHQKIDFYKEAYRLLKSGGRLVMAEYIRADRNMNEVDENILQAWCSGWSMPDLDTWEEHKTNMTVSGFTQMEYSDITHNVRPSLNKLHRISKKLLNFGNLLHLLRIRNHIKHNNHKASIHQYEALDRNLWFYSIITAQKT